MFISFSNGTGSAFENSLDSGYPFASVPARLKTTLLDVVAETGRDLVFGTTARLSDLSMSLTGECLVPKVLDRFPRTHKLQLRMLLGNSNSEERERELNESSGNSKMKTRRKLHELL